jgi:prephenate dehydrogenase
VGLIGGSLAIDLRRRGLAGEIIGVGRGAGNLAVARRRGIVDRFTSDPVEGVRDADLVVLATPVGALAEVGKAIAPALMPGAVVTDVGSTKVSVIRDLEPLMPGLAYFVAAHPIAGTEDSGAGAAMANLFEGARCILTPTPRTNPAALAKVGRLWRAVGARVFEMDAAAHDRILGAVSHLPHVVAYALVNAVTALQEDALDYAGGGFRDFTRIAASHPDMWRDIMLANSEPILSGIDAVLIELESLRDAIEAQNGKELAEAFTRARERRRALDAPGGAKPRRGAARKRNR